jgi:20S proteasome subunit alpha 5
MSFICNHFIQQLFVHQLGSTAIGIQTSEGVVLAVEKRITSPLLEPSSIEKILEIDTHVGCAMSGLVADWRTMLDYARVEAQVHVYYTFLLTSILISLS